MEGKNLVLRNSLSVEQSENVTRDRLPIQVDEVLHFWFTYSLLNELTRTTDPLGFLPTVGKQKKDPKSVKVLSSSRSLLFSDDFYN